jgi:hypothetical protein
MTGQGVTDRRLALIVRNRNGGGRRRTKRARSSGARVNRAQYSRTCIATPAVIEPRAHRLDPRCGGPRARAGPRRLPGRPAQWRHLNSYSRGPNGRNGQARLEAARQVDGGSATVELETNSRQITPKHHGKPAIIRDQRTRPVNKIDNFTKSAKPPSPVQIRAAPPFLTSIHSATCGFGRFQPCCRL